MSATSSTRRTDVRKMAFTRTECTVSQGLLESEILPTVSRELAGTLRLSLKHTSTEILRCSATLPSLQQCLSLAKADKSLQYPRVFTTQTCLQLCHSKLNTTT
jgi:hypothetical protein